MGIVLFGSTTDDLYDLVQELSREGQDRLLAIKAGGQSRDAAGWWRLLAAGASDVLDWDPHGAASIVAKLRRWHRVDQVVDSPVVVEELAGESAAWRAILRQIVEVAAFSDLSVLITGESGTGKELIARLVHHLDTREDKRDLVVLDCTTVVPSLSGSEFFGHERGSFTGAIRSRDGAFATADGGTLFLDEIGELSLGLQAELLRVVQEGTYKRVGGDTWRKTQFRLVCATNRDLVEEEQRGAFRRDFYHRIAAWRCHLPSLRERTQDILPLTRHFLREFSPAGRVPQLDAPVVEFLLQRPYPGNVRELRNLVERLVRRHVGDGPITVGDIPRDELTAMTRGSYDWADEDFEQCVRRALASGASLKEISAITRDTAIRVALVNSDGNLQRASRALGVTDRALQLRRAARLGRNEHPAEPAEDERVHA